VVLTFVTITSISAPGNDVGDEISADPPDNSGVHISDLKQGRHLRVSRSSINVDHVCHPPIIGITVAADHRHARFDGQEYGCHFFLWSLERDHGMVDRHTNYASTPVLAMARRLWQCLECSIQYFRNNGEFCVLGSASAVTV